MDNLRLILILIGLVILALIWFLHQPRGRRRPGATRRESQRIEPDLSGSGDRQDVENEIGERSADDVIGEPRQTSLPSLNRGGDDPEPARVAASGGRREPVWNDPSAETGTGPEPEARPRDAHSEKQLSAADGQDDDAPKVVTLYIRARQSRRISGVSLLDAAIKAGLRFGDMNIFHRRQEGADDPVFSMANLISPGSFDPAAWNLFETPGVTLFMTLPGPITALDAWDAMLATGQRLAGLLDAELLDDAQCQVTRQRIAQVREELREYDRKNEWQR